jgi:hypothetical protein
MRLDLLGFFLMHGRYLLGLKYNRRQMRAIYRPGTGFTGILT